MKINYKDETFIFNKEESAEAIRLCTGFLNDMRGQCENKDILTFYVMILFVMHELTESAIDNIGIDGIQAMFMKRIRIDNSTTEDSSDQE
jgi:hypothetical protein